MFVRINESAKRPYNRVLIGETRSLCLRRCSCVSFKENSIALDRAWYICRIMDGGLFLCLDGWCECSEGVWLSVLLVIVMSRWMVLQDNETAFVTP